MATKMKARDLGLDDLRYDVEFDELWGHSGRRRVVGQLHKIEGPYAEAPVNGARRVVVRLTIGSGSQMHRHDVAPESEVTVDRAREKRGAVHFGTEATS